MVPYFCLLLIPLFLQMILKTSNAEIVAGKSVKRITHQNIVMPVFFVCFFLLLTLRDQTLGRDLANYHIIFNQWGAESLPSIFSSWKECFFKLYCWLFYNFFSKNYQLFISFTAFITVLPIACVYLKDKTHGYMKAAIFVNMSTFIMLFSGIRQGLAMSAGILAYQAVKDNKIIKYIIWVIVAFLFHHTGFMTLFLLPLYKFRFRRNDLLWIIPCGTAVFVFREKLFNFLALLASNIDDKYSATAKNTGAIGSFILFLLLTVFCFVITDEQSVDDETLALRNILVFATFLQIFASVNNLAMRMNYYFILLIPIAVGNCINHVNPQYKQVAKAGEIIISGFFTGYFFYTTYQSYITGISTLDTVPYIPFWR